MPRTVNVHEAKTHLSRLLEQSTKTGEAFIIARAGKPVATVTPISEEAYPPRRVGFLKGRYVAGDDFKDMGREAIQKAFEGET